MVGPFTDVHCRLHGISTALPHVERCELLRHIRWVDQVIHDAPVVIDGAFLSRHCIDYVAIEEGTSLDPSVSKVRLSGYDLVKSLGKFTFTALYLIFRLPEPPHGEYC
jgi:choline-phosphate cytidylyltransferase